MIELEFIEMLRGWNNGVVVVKWKLIEINVKLFIWILKCSSISVEYERCDLEGFRVNESLLWVMS